MYHHYYYYCRYRYTTIKPATAVQVPRTGNRCILPTPPPLPPSPSFHMVVFSRTKQKNTNQVWEEEEWNRKEKKSRVQ